MQIYYVRPEESDIPEIEKLLRITFQDTFRKNNINSIFEIEEEIESKIVNVRKDIISRDRKYHFLIAKNESLVVGICAYFPVSVLIIDNIDNINKDDLEIGCTYIHPEFQKMGIGNKLFAMTIEEMKRNYIKHYYLSSGFESSQKYWKEKLGDPLSIIENIWGIGKHEYVWKMSIK